MEKIWYNSYPEGVPREIDPDQYQSVVDLFEERCHTFKEKNAVTNLGITLTYGQLEEKTRYFAAYLQQELHLHKGDRIAIMLPNTIQFYIALFGALRAGLIVVNTNPLYTKRELVEQLNNSQAETIIVLENFAHTVESSLGEVKLKNIIVTKLGDLCNFPKKQIVNFIVKYIKRMVPSYHLPKATSLTQALEKGRTKVFDPVTVEGSDTAFLQYTGGTTGVSKGAVLSHRNIVSNILQGLAWTGDHLSFGSEIAVLPLPLYHILSLTGGGLMMVAAGAESILITNPRDIPHFIKELKGKKFTFFMGINTLCNALLNNVNFKDVDFSHLKIVIVGGMAATKDVAKRWRDVTGVTMTEGYGLTETSPIVTINSFDTTDFTGGIGFPVPSTDVKIIDEDEKEVPLGEIGELAVRGPQVMQNYWNNPAETRKAFTSDGWLKTGDMVKMDQSGLVTLVDRKKDMIIVSGFNVYPNEVESVLMSHPKINEVAVIGVIDEVKGGEQVKAIIVKRDDSLTKEEVVVYCKKQLTAYKVPHIIEFQGELPKTPVGKILRRKLREKESAHKPQPEELKKAA